MKDHADLNLVDINLFVFFLHLLEASLHGCHCRLRIFDGLDSVICLFQIETLLHHIPSLCFIPAHIQH